MAKSYKKVFVFGLDGATWKIINPLLSKGDLPNLNKLITSGVSAKLLSIEPPFSPAVWTTISTGMLPQKHGINFFFSHSKMVKTPRIWDILEKQGLIVGVYGHLVTWPPRAIKGFIIPDNMLSQDAQTYPPEYTFLRQMVIDGKERKPRDLFGYLKFLLGAREFGIKWYHLLKGLKILANSKVLNYQFLDKYYRQRFLKEDLQSDGFIHLNRKHNCDFSYYYCNITDSCAHLYWKYMEPENIPRTSVTDVKKFGDVIPSAYRKADAILGKILRSLHDSTSIWVVSDHGFKAASTNHKGSMSIIKTEFLVKVLSIEEKVQFGNLGSRSFLSVNKPFEHEKAHIIASINEIRISENNHKVFACTDDKSEGKINIVLKETDKSLKNYHVKINGNLYGYRTLVEEGGARISGEHDPEGIFIAKGEGIAKGKWIKDKCGSVVDITPTLLAYLGLPIGRDMDGHVIREAFEKGYLTKNQLSYIDSYGKADVKSEMEGDYEPDEAIKERLRTLGYL